MKKIVLTSTIALAAFTTFASQAGTTQPAGEPGRVEIKEAKATEISDSDNKRLSKSVKNTESIRPATRLTADCSTENADCRRGDRKRLSPMDGITLTETQEARVFQAQEEREKKQRKLREKVEKERRKISKAYMKQMHEILTPEQFARFKANVEACKKAAKTDKKHFRKSENEGKKGD